MRLLFFIILQFSSLAFSKTLIIENNDSYELKDYFQFFHDKKGLLSIEEVSNPSFSRNFHEEIPEGGGFYEGVVWAKIKILNRAQVSKFIAEYKWLIADLRYYKLDKFAGIVSEKAGVVNYPQSIKNSSAVLKLNLLPEENEHDIYFRFEYNDPLNFNVVLYRESDFLSIDHDRQIFYGLYLGVVLALILLNIALFSAFRDARYLYYCGSLIFTHLLGVTLLFGLLSEYIFSFETLIKFGLPNLFGSAMTFFNLLFSSSFLGTKDKLPFLHKVSNFLSCISLVMMVLSVVIPYNLLVSFVLNYLIIFVSFYILFLAGFLAFKKDREAFWFLLSWSVLVFSTAIHSLCIQGTISDNVYTRNLVFVGSGIEAIMISLLLAIQLKQIVKDKLRLQMDNLNAKVERAEVLNKIMNDHLHKIKNYIFRLYYLFESKKEKLFLGDHGSINLLDEAFLDTIQKSKDDLERRLTRESFLTGRHIAIIYEKIVSDYEKESVKFKFSCAERDRSIDMSYQDFYNILDSLISNAVAAVRFSNEKNIFILVEIDTLLSKVTVEDSGVGFSDKILSKYGNGLGLKRISEILSSYNSKLEINSVEGKGSKISFVISSFRKDKN